MFKNDRTNFSKNTTTEEAKIILKELNKFRQRPFKFS